MNISPKQAPWVIAFVAALFFFPFLGGVHLFDWDEINFAEIAREMIATNNWSATQIDYAPFYEKPPLFVWMQALAMRIFGVGEYAARFPNAVCGMVTLLVLYFFGKKTYNHTFGLVWAAVYLGSILPFFYFKTGIIDPWFNLFIFLGVWYFIDYVQQAQQHKRAMTMILAGVFTGLAILTKGPVGFLIPCLTYFVYWVRVRFKMYVSVPQFLLYCLATFFVSGFWYMIDFMLNGPEFLLAFFSYQVELFSTESAGHGGFFGYHFVVLLIGCFPGSILKLGAYQRIEEPTGQKELKRWMFYLFWVVLILFSIVESKIVHYSSMCYYPLTYLGAWTLYQAIEGKVKIPLISKILFFIIGGVLALVCLVVPYVGQHISIIEPLVSSDANALGAVLAPVDWSWIAALPGVMMLGVLIYCAKMFSQPQVGRSLIAGLLMATFSLLALISYIKRAEGHSQRAVIEFCTSKIGEDVLVYPLKHHSYAHLFYTKKQPQASQRETLFSNPPKKPVFFIVKEGNLKKIEAQRPQLTELYRKGGFVFFELK